jgi:hypothetical protein
MTLPPLSPLSGTAPPDTWRITTADLDEANGRFAIFAIVKRVPPPQSVQLLGTGFYLQTKGGFATAAHVAEEAQQLLAGSPGSVGIAHTLPKGRTMFLPIWKFFTHPTADVAFGVPRLRIRRRRYRPGCPRQRSLSRAVSERSESTGPFPAHLHKIARRTIVTDTT